MALRNQDRDAQRMYDERSAKYDDSWHPRFARHMVEIVGIQRDEHVLDLACGTGLVSFLASKMVGPNGSVIGIDISGGMLAEAEKKRRTHSLDNLSFHQHSITKLNTFQLMENRKFDVITCASALVLLHQPASALRDWATYLKPGGRIVVDVTHPQSQLTGIIMERVAHNLGASVPFHRLAFQQPCDIQRLLQLAGLEQVEVISMSQHQIEGKEELIDYLCSSSGPPVSRTYQAAEADSVFDNTVERVPFEELAKSDLILKARETFKLEWTKLADVEGLVKEVDCVYVGLGRKPF